LNLSKEIIETLISNKFEIDCIDISLTQQTEENRIIYSGPGTVYQDENGVLNLKLYVKIKDLKEELNQAFKHFTPGKIIGDEHYFSFRAVDMSGNEWCSENIWVSGTVSFPTAGKVIKSKLEEIKNIAEIDKRIRSEKTYLFIVLPGDYKIPCNEKEDLPNGGWRLNRSVFSANQVDFEFKKHDNYLTINASTITDVLEGQTEIKILEALSIIYGQVLRPIIIDYSHGDSKKLRIKSVNDKFSNKQLPYPFNYSSPSDLESFACFLEKYLSAIKNPFSELFGFWHKINRAWQASIENSSLSLAVAIEGLVKSYFVEYGLPDQDILQQAQDAKQKFKELEIGERIKKRLLSSLGGLNNVSPKSALFQISKKGLLPKSFADEWVTLRNKSAHPDKIDKDQKATQAYIDQIYTCITLFYSLLFLIIKYEGNFIDFSQNGWPEKKFSLVKEG
jgi:hypothetical protein